MERKAVLDARHGTRAVFEDVRLETSEYLCHAGQEYPHVCYLAFLREHPDLEPVLPQPDVAAYVRVTPVALSRIRGRLRRKGGI